MRRLALVDSGVAGGSIRQLARGSMKVAFATQDLKNLDAHFGGARNMAIFEVTKEGYRFLEACRFDSQSKEDGVHAEDGSDPISKRVDALDGCALLFVLAIGGPAAARVVAAKIHPVKLPKPEPITDILDRLIGMLNGTPPPWLRKALKDATGAQPAFLEGEED